MPTLATLRAKLLLDSSDFEKKLTSASAKFKKAGDSMTATGKKLSRNVTLPLVAAAGASVKFASDFESSMTRINTLVGLTEDQVASLGDSMLELAPKVGRGPNELARALFTVTSAGLEAEDALRVVELSAKAAAIGLGDTQEVARAVTGALASYADAGLTAEQATAVMIATVQEGNLEAQDLAATLGRVTGIASQVGVSFADLGGFIATFTRLGVNAEEAVTALRGVLNTLVNPSEGARKALASIGSSVEDLRASIEDKGLAQTLVDLVEKFKGNETALAKIIPNVRALAGVLGTAGAQGEDFVEITQNINDAMNDASNVIETRFQKAMETATAQWGVFKANLEVAAITIGNVLLPILIPLIKKIGEWAAAFAELDPFWQKVIIGAAALAAALGPVLVVFGSIVGAIGTLLPVLGGLAVALAAVTAPAALVVAGLVALGAAFVVLLQKSETFRNSFVTLIKGGLKVAADAFGAFGALVTGDWGELWRRIQLMALEGAKAIIDSIIQFVSSIREKLGALGKVFDGLLRGLAASRNEMDLFIGKLRDQNTVVEEATRKFDASKESIFEFENAELKAKQEAGKLEGALGDLETGTGSLTGATGALTTATVAQADAFQEVNKAYAEQEAQLTKTARELEEMRLIGLGLDDLQVQLALSTYDHVEALREQKEAADRSAEAIKRHTDRLNIQRLKLQEVAEHHMSGATAARVYELAMEGIHGQAAENIIQAEFQIEALKAIGENNDKLAKNTDKNVRIMQDAFGEFFDENMPDWLRKTLGWADGLLGVFGGLGGGIGSFINDVTGFFDKGFSDWLGGGLDFVKNFGKSMNDGLGGIFTGIGNFISGPWGAAIMGALNLFGIDVGEVVSKIASVAVDGVKAIGKGIAAGAKAIGSAVGTLASGVASAVGKVASGVASAVSSIGKGIASILGFGGESPEEQFKRVASGDRMTQDAVRMFEEQFGYTPTTLEELGQVSYGQPRVGAQEFSTDPLDLLPSTRERMFGSGSAIGTGTGSLSGQDRSDGGELILKDTISNELNVYIDSDKVAEAVAPKLINRQLATEGP